MEIGSGIELDWFFEQWLYTTNTVDYGIKYVFENENGLNITLEKKGEMPMPVEVLVNYKSGRQELYYIPLRLMRGNKDLSGSDFKTWILDDWPWTHPEYNFTIDAKATDIKSIFIDPKDLTPDMKRRDDIFPNKDVTYESKGKTQLR